MDKILVAWHAVTTFITAFVIAHPRIVGALVGLYILIATGINRRLEKPTTWYGKLAHFVFLDWPASLATKNADAHGFVIRLGKYEIAMPFASWSRAFEEAESAIVETLTKASLLLCVLSASACMCVPQKGKVDGESCAYQVLTALDAAVGATARISRTELRKCGDEAKALRNDAQALKGKDEAAYETKLQASIDKSNECVQKTDVVARVVIGAEDSTQTVADGIPVVAKAVQKDWNGLIQPAIKNIQDGVKLLVDQGIKIPVEVTTLLGLPALLGVK